ncbi:MAG TPA: V-type ATP synthase subunit D [Thermoplasmatales archaeon]|nr:V-type ATP synthase subunit D [Thermoplasmatales archaeon]HEX17464.1 V-type ATP synthase subunit D [Thermoplasmatales archaeon]
MKEQAIEGIKPTRMELLRVRRRLELAERGHRLLEDKRDALIENFFRFIKRRDEIRKEVETILGKAMDALLDAEMVMGVDKVRIMARLSRKVGEVEFFTDNVMGVRIPKINKENLKLEEGDRFIANLRLEEARMLFREALVKLLDLAEVDGAIRSLALEIERTKRRVNVLENIVIPRLQATRKRIEMLLEEREREEFFRRKRIKALMERRKVGG